MNNKRKKELRAIADQVYEYFRERIVEECNDATDDVDEMQFVLNRVVEQFQVPKETLN